MKVNNEKISSYQTAKLELEKGWIEKMMQDCNYNQSRAAANLGMSRGTLRMKLKEYFGDKYFRSSYV
jgi:DNA-binding protein Fis